MAKTSDFYPLRNKERQYKHKTTGEIISRRQWQKIKRGGMSNEKFAELNRVTNEKLQVLQPARGRKSALKKTDTEKEMIAEARIEDRQRREQIAISEREARLLERRIKKAQAKRVRAKAIRPQLLKAGNMGARISLNDYNDYLKAFEQGKNATVRLKNGARIPLVFSYGLGMVGVNENTGQDLGITVFTMRTFDRPIAMDEFYDEMEATLAERAYFVFSHYFMHVAFSKAYANEKAASRGKKN